MRGLRTRKMVDQKLTDTHVVQVRYPACNADRAAADVCARCLCYWYGGEYTVC